jgi:hypothetical protein
MGFARSSFRAPRPAGSKAAVFAVGRRVYVASTNDRSVSVTLTDDGGKTPVANLGDGTEVAILAWRPGWSGNTRYHVRTTSSGVEGWIPVGNLRGTVAAVVPGVAALAVPTARPARKAVPVASGIPRAGLVRQ